ncbi:MAG: NAD(P)H-hydrate dehydratase, partial [Patescibacteria group bacterium]|nr:NAD(P)H-hydrate dehydratase [Patescibacteria group bacterium]
DDDVVKKVFKNFNFPKKDSHKGENGRILIIGGSSLFHSAVLWSAETASYFVDLVHFSSTKENEKIFLNLKTKFRNGIVIKKENLDDYIKEDDVVLVGTGMVRKTISNIKYQISNIFKNYNDLITKVKDEAEYTYFLTKYLIDNYPEKKIVFDAGSIQMMNKDWLLNLKTTPIITPHQKEFENLFKIKIANLSIEKKAKIVKETAKKYKITILLKAIKDIVSDGESIYIIDGGNQGLTKGGTGDVLASLASCFYIKNNCLDSAVFASVLLKKTADELFNNYGYWYNVNIIINQLPKTLKNILI